MAEYILKGENQNISTLFDGTISLLNYYNYAKRYSNCWITLNFDGINFLDANLSALLYGIIYDLKKRYGVKTFIDFKTLGKDLNVLMRNGFTNYVAGKEFLFKPYDARDTTIPLMIFNQNEIDLYCGYIERDFLRQRGLDSVKLRDKERIEASYLEIFENVSLHANTIDPIFVCGQYFPKQSELKFTLVDLGDGFLKKISAFTMGKENITLASKAVSWAIKGNTTKVGAMGGTGLKGIFNLCYKNGGSLHIMTDDCYYSFTNKTVTTQRIPNSFKGATIHLIFRFLS